MYSCADNTDIEYEGNDSPQRYLAKLQRRAKGESIRTISMHAGFSEKHVSNILNGRTLAPKRTVRMVACAIEAAKVDRMRASEAVKINSAKLTEMVARNGLRATARELCMDPSNLRRKIS